MLSRHCFGAAVGVALICVASCASFTSLSASAHYGGNEVDRVVSVTATFPAGITIETSGKFYLEFDTSMSVSQPQTLHTGGYSWCAYLTGKTAAGTVMAITSFASTCSSSAASDSTRYIDMTIAQTISASPTAISVTTTAGDVVKLRFWRMISNNLSGTVTVKYFDSSSVEQVSGTATLDNATSSLVPQLGLCLLLIVGTLLFTWS